MQALFIGKESIMDQNLNSNPDFQQNNPNSLENSTENYQPNLNSDNVQNLQPQFQANPNDNPQLQANQTPQYQADPFFQEYQAPVYANQFRPIKKKINPLAIIIPIIALVTAAAVLLIFMLNKTDYKKSEQKYFTDMFDRVLSVAEKKEANPDPQTVSINFQSPLDNIMGNILDISNIDVKYDTAVNGKNIYGITSFKMGDIDLNSEYWFNGGESYLMLFLPDISDIYLKAEIGTELKKSSIPEASDMLRVFKDVCSKTSDTYFDIIGEPEVLKNQEFKVGGKTYTADKTVIHLDSVQCATLVKAFYTNILDNEEAVKMICDLYSLENKEELQKRLYDEFHIAEIESVINGQSGANAYLDMTVYLKNKNIIGRQIQTNSTDNRKSVLELYNIPTEAGSVKYVTAGGDSYNYESDADEYKTFFTVLNEDTVKNNIHSGTAVISVNDNEINISYNDFAVTEKLFQGTASLSVKDNPGFEASMELSTNDTVKTAVIKIPNIFTLTVTAQPSALQYKDAPSPSDDKLAVLNSEEEYWNNEQFEKFAEDVSKFINKFSGYDDDVLGSQNIIVD